MPPPPIPREGTSPSVLPDHTAPGWRRRADPTQRFKMPTYLPADSPLSDSGEGLGEGAVTGRRVPDREERDQQGAGDADRLISVVMDGLRTTAPAGERP